MAMLLPLLVLTAALATGASAPQTPFAVTVTLSPAAAAELKNAGEQVKIAAYYYWRPVFGGPDHESDEFGYVLGGYPLGQEAHETQGNEPVRFLGRTNPDSHIRPGQGEARALINVFSARKTLANNILSCDVFDDALVVAAKGIILRCSLITEQN